MQTLMVQSGNLTEVTQRTDKSIKMSEVEVTITVKLDPINTHYQTIAWQVTTGEKEMSRLHQKI